MPDATGRERLVCHYAHMESLEKMLGHGLAVYDDDARPNSSGSGDAGPGGPAAVPRPGPSGPARDGGVEYLFLGEVFPIVRVPAEVEAVLDLDRLRGLDLPGEPGLEPRRLAGKARRRRAASALGGRRGVARSSQHGAQADRARAQSSPTRPGSSRRTSIPGQPVTMHRGTVSWNAFRRRWILIATEIGGTSQLGEVWYAEAAEPTGPGGGPRRS